MKDFTAPVPQELLNIENKTRSNLFAWRGQFSPQLIECLLEAYCPPESAVLDPFAGSGTVLYESAKMHMSAVGYEIAPSAWSFSKLYEFVNVSLMERENAISELQTKIDAEFPITIFQESELTVETLETKVIRISQPLGDRAKILFTALVVILDIYNNHVTSNVVQHKFASLTNLVRQLPYSALRIKADLQDARALPLQGQTINFVMTSPPYINVFNYHQNYRRSAEILGWNLLRVARSEIGSNRANRTNRFNTVTQYCIDMADVLSELSRVLAPDGRAVMILGYESKVLGARFYNADIVERLARLSDVFDIALRQKRVFTNRFGLSIREDILNLQRAPSRIPRSSPTTIGRKVAAEALNAALSKVPPQNRASLLDAVSRINQIFGTPVFDSLAYSEYQTRAEVMMVKERGVTYGQ